MKTLTWLLILAAAPAFAAAQATKEDLKKLAKSGVSEDVILEYLKTNGYAGKPTSDDLVELKEAGLTDRVLTGLFAPPTPKTSPPEVNTEPPVSTYATGSLSVGPSYYAAPYGYVGYRPYYYGYGSYYRYGYWAPYYGCHSYYGYAVPRRPYYYGYTRRPYYSGAYYTGRYYSGSGSTSSGRSYATGTMSR